jgi:hypothetical protein
VAYDRINLAEQVTNTLAVANGGTGATSLSGVLVGNGTGAVTAAAPLGVSNGGTGQSTLASGALLLGAGTSGITTLAPGSNGNVALVSGGAWTSGPAPAPTTWTTTVSSATTLTLAAGTQAYVFSGTTTTWTLPAVSSSNGVYFHIENRGTGNITLNPSGTDHIWFTSALTTTTIAPNGSLIVFCDGTYWNMMSNDLVNNSVGTLSVANGGTGAATFSGGLLKAAGTAAFTTVTAPVGTLVGTSDTQTLTNKTEQGVTVSGYTETPTTATVTTSYTFSLATSTFFVLTLTNADTCVCTMPTATAGQSFFVLVHQPSTTGSGLITFTSVKWPAATAPSMTQGSNATDLYSFFSDGTSWYGSYTQGY